jgi:THO complex subunit 4
MPSAPRRNPFDTAHMPGRPLADRITVPSGRSRSLSPNYYADDDRVDRYVPSGPGRRSRSPLPPRRGGRRPGQRREGAQRGGRDAPRGDNGGGGGGRDGRRPKKTQEELDAEMQDYFGPPGTAAAAAPAAADTTANEAQGDDMDMIE